MEAGAVGRDATIVCIAEVKNVQVATIGFGLRERQRMALQAVKRCPTSSGKTHVDGLVESSVAHIDSDLSPCKGSVGFSSERDNLCQGLPRSPSKGRTGGRGSRDGRGGRSISSRCCF